MNILKKLICVGALALLVGGAPASASSSAIVALPEMGSVASQIAVLISREVQVYVGKVVTSQMTLKTRSPQVTIEDTHMIIVAERLPPESEPFRALSGPRKKQPRS